MLLLCTGMAFAGSLEPGLGWAHAQLSDRHQTGVPANEEGVRAEPGPKSWLKAEPGRAPEFVRMGWLDGADWRCNSPSCHSTRHHS